MDYFSSIKEVMPLSGAPEPKRRFVPSKWETMRVNRVVRGLMNGTLLSRAENKARRQRARPESEASFAAAAEAMWADDEEAESLEDRKGPMHITAPKLALPGHAESYRPPAEYLEDEEDDASYDEFEARPFKPKSHDSLRAVAAYEGAIQDRFQRCLDLYLCPRAFKRRLNIDPETLVPQLPSPQELKPFPNALARVYEGHTARVRGVSCSPDGQWLASCAEDGELRIWEVMTGRCVTALTGEHKLPAPVSDVRWNPSKEHHVVAVAAADGVYLVQAGTARGDDRAITDALLGASGADDADAPDDEDDAEEPQEDMADESDEDDAAAAARPAKAVARWKLSKRGTVTVLATKLASARSRRVSLFLSQSSCRSLAWARDRVPSLARASDLLSFGFSHAYFKTKRFLVCACRRRPPCRGTPRATTSCRSRRARGALCRSLCTGRRGASRRRPWRSGATRAARCRLPPSTRPNPSCSSRRAPPCASTTSCSSGWSRRSRAAASGSRPSTCTPRATTLW